MWNDKKIEEMHTKKQQKINIITTSYEEEIKKNKDKKKVAEKAFQIWKETKDSDLQEKIHKLKQTMADKKEKDKKNSKSESEKAFILW
jgi:hypothetical protein